MPSGRLGPPGSTGASRLPKPTGRSATSVPGIVEVPGSHLGGQGTGALVERTHALQAAEQQALPVVQALVDVQREDVPPAGRSDTERDRDGVVGLVRDRQGDAAHAELPGPLRGAPVQAHGRLPRRQTLDLDVLPADPSDAQAEDLRDGLLGSPAAGERLRAVPDIASLAVREHAARETLAEPRECGLDPLDLDDVDAELRGPHGHEVGWQARIPVRVAGCHPLLHRHRLGEVPWLVHVGAPRDRGVVREQLERDHGEDRRQRLVRVGHPQHLVREPRDRGVALGGHRDHLGVARPALHDVADQLVVDPRPGGDRDQRALDVEQRDRAVLELPGGVALRVDVADLLELEGTLESPRETVPAADEHETAGVHVPAGDVRHACRQVQRARRRVRERSQRETHLELGRGIHAAAGLGDGGSEHHQGRHLGHEGLRGRHRDLRAGLEEHDRIGLARDRGADGVGHRDDRTAPLAGQARRGDRVRGLAGLGDGDHERVRIEGRRRVAELRTHRDPRRDPGPFLDRCGANQGSVRGGAAGDQLHPVHPPERVGQPVHLGGVDGSGGRDPPGERLAQGRGLLVDLLEHEVVVAALLGGLRRPVDQRLCPHEPVAVEIGHLHARGPHIGHVALLQEDHAVRVREDRCHVARDEALLAVEAHDERHVQAGPDETADLAPVHDHERVGALDAPERRADRVREITPVGVLDEVGDGLRVGLRGEPVAARLQVVPELAEVLDDPVVDDGDVTAAILVGMGVEVVRPAMGGPAGVGEADGRVGRPVGDRRLEVDELAGFLLHEHPAVLADERDPRRVVAAVLEPRQAFDQDGAGLAGSGVTDDAAHAASGSPSGRPRPAAAGLV